MRYPSRKINPRVVGGKTQKKNNWALSPDHYRAPVPRMVLVDRKRPGVGYAHVLLRSDIYRFLELLPDWDHLAVGLNAIVLGDGTSGYDGRHRHGVVEVCAWEKGFWREVCAEYHDDHAKLFERLGVPCELVRPGTYLCRFDEPAARAYQLMHILLHELGHHHDRMTSRRRLRCGRGEPYAEAYALEHEAAIWHSYHREFSR